MKAGGRNGGCSTKTAGAGKTAGIVKEAFAGEMRRLKIARAERGVRGNLPCLLWQALPRARAARRSQSNGSAPRLGGPKTQGGFYAAAYRLRQAGRRAEVGRQGHGQGGTIDSDGLRPLLDKHAVKRRMHPQFTRRASGA